MISLNLISYQYNHYAIIPQQLRSYWSYRDELTIENGIIMKGKQLLIPEPFRADILNQLHASHQGIDKTRRLAIHFSFFRI